MRTKTEILDEKFAYGKREWNECWSIPTAARRNWQILALVEGVALIGSVAGLIYLGSLPKLAPYVLQVQKNGEMSYIGKPDTMAAETWDRVRMQVIRQFISDWRSVISDQSAQLIAYKRAWAYVGDGSPANTMLAAWYEANDPLQRASHGQGVSVRYKTSDREGDNTFGIWWEETVAASGGMPAVTTEYRARVTYKMQLPKREEAARENGLGLLITDISFERVNQ